MNYTDVLASARHCSSSLFVKEKLFIKWSTPSVSGSGLPQEREQDGKGISNRPIQTLKLFIGARLRCLVDAKMIARRQLSVCVGGHLQRSDAFWTSHCFVSLLLLFLFVEELPNLYERLLETKTTKVKTASTDYSNRISLNIFNIQTREQI
jgi:hypothetical protein